jgi:hypothetical protein
MGSALQGWRCTNLAARNEAPSTPPERVGNSTVRTNSSSGSDCDFDFCFPFFLLFPFPLPGEAWELEGGSAYTRRLCVVAITSYGVDFWDELWYGEEIRSLQL